MNRIVWLILGCLFFGGVSSAQSMMSLKKKGITRAVVVGISEYQDEGIKDLRYAHRDAALFVDFLKSKPGGGITDQQLILLANEAATMAAVQSALQWLLDNTRKNDQAIIYFAGHGDVETKDRQEKGYLLAYDTPKNNYRLNAIDLQYLSEDVISQLSAKGAKVVVIADACHSGALAGEKIGGREATANELMKRFGNEIRIMSCQPYELSLEGPEFGGGRGVFSYYLINGLQGGQADQNRDQQVDLYELGNYLQDRIRTATDKKQHPDIFGGIKQESLFWIDDATAAELKAIEQTEISRNLEEQVLKRLATDVGYTNYIKFNQALEKGRLFYPPQTSAVYFFDALKTDTTFRLLSGIINEKLTVALLDSAQQAINAYLNTDPLELAQRDRFDNKYGRFAQYLRKAADILGPGDSRYRQTLAKQHYFEGLSLRLDAERQGGDDSLFQLALQHQQQALALEDRAAYIYNELGLVLRGLGKYEQSMAQFIQAVAISPAWALPYNNLGICYEELDSLDLARRNFAAAITRKPDLASAYTNMGNLFFTLELVDSAEMMYRKAIKLYPADKSNYYFMGLLLSALEGRQEEAKTFYLQALQLDQNYPEAAYELGVYYYIEEQADSAELLFRKAIANAPDFTQAYLLLGLLYFDNNRQDEAEYMFFEAIRTDSLFAPAYECLVTMYQQTWHKAVNLLQTAPLLNEEKINVLYQSGLSFYRNQSPEDALRAFQTAIQLDAGQPLGYYALCTYYTLQGRFDDALLYLEKTLEKAQARSEDYYDQIVADENLDPLRRHDKFGQLMAKYFPH